MWIAINTEPEAKDAELALIFQNKSNVITDLFNKLLSDKKVKFSDVSKMKEDTEVAFYASETLNTGPSRYLLILRRLTVMKEPHIFNKYI